MRLFIAIHFPEDIIDRINLLQGELRSKIKGGRLPGRENMHLTLQFLGETPQRRIDDIIGALETVARANKSFTLSLGRLGYFGHGNPVRVVWLGVGGDIAALRQLQGSVVSAMQVLDFKEDSRPYTPHITLVREADFIHREVLLERGRIKLDTGEAASFPVDKFSLLSSSVEHGKRVYRDLATFELGLPK